MKKTVSFLLLLFILLFLVGCGKDKSFSPSEEITLFPKSSDNNEFTIPPEATTYANKTHGDEVKDEEFSYIMDSAEEFRTEDSYLLEPIALQYAKRQASKNTKFPDSLQIINTNVWNCLDDGNNTYYTLCLTVAYKVDTGESVQRDLFYEVGVIKKSKKAFDSSSKINDVSEKYSIFNQNEIGIIVQVPVEEQANGFEFAVKDIVAKHLKSADSAAVEKIYLLDVPQNNPEVHIYSVHCRGMNDYKMSISSVYFVGVLSESDSAYREVDPVDYDFEKIF